MSKKPKDLSELLKASRAKRALEGSQSQPEAPRPSNVRDRLGNFQPKQANSTNETHGRSREREQIDSSNSPFPPDLQSRTREIVYEGFINPPFEPYQARSRSDSGNGLFPDHEPGYRRQGDQFGGGRAQDTQFDEVHSGPNVQFGHEPSASQGGLQFNDGWDLSPIPPFIGDREHRSQFIEDIRHGYRSPGPQFSADRELDSSRQFNEDVRPGYRSPGLQFRGDREPGSQRQFNEDIRPRYRSPVPHFSDGKEQGSRRQFNEDIRPGYRSPVPQISDGKEQGSRRQLIDDIRPGYRSPVPHFSGDREPGTNGIIYFCNNGVDFVHYLGFKQIFEISRIFINLVSFKIIITSNLIEYFYNLLCCV